jgi:hypothetical protein
MISVVMPTMWVPEATLDTIKLISKNKHVGEIIIIDNAPELNMSVEGIDKVTYIRESSNTFVNPAWNKGVRLAKYDKIFLASDDVITDWSILDTLYPHIIEEVGIIGPSDVCWDPRKTTENGVVEFEEIGYRPPCYGCAMFFHKNSYTPIPEEIKVHYGDDWIFNKSNKPNLHFRNWMFSGESEQTSGKEEFNEIKNQDRINYLKLS